MKLVRFYPPGFSPPADGPGALMIGLLEHDRVIPVAEPAWPGDDQVLQIAMSRQRPQAIADPFPVSDVRLLPPLGAPSSIRDFLTFEQHYANFLLGQTGSAGIPDEWYRTPVFYFTSTAVVYGPGATIPRPVTEQLDFELEVSVVLGRPGADVSPAAAADLIAGYTMFNDFSARDVQRREMALGLGASKSKDFANALGPCLATPDELAGPAGAPDARVTCRVNGREYGSDSLKNMHHSFAEMIAHASRASRLRVGDVLGSGTAASGCIMELAGVHGHDRYPWLEPGDVVEIEAEGIGILRNTVGARP